ncbi:hypothetical protein KIN20_005709 [Parelaphostrongylus tenuis]|uniref:Ferredoxin n=1 Tax=Parelaphostrongylus tenuis TaxID=148309 RepID=A0AAD5M4Y3_PARTN|nr:hypothetical protein KIN20_005709 [Parelaphostrongylus tenuis]
MSAAPPGTPPTQWFDFFTKSLEERYDAQGIPRARKTFWATLGRDMERNGSLTGINGATGTLACCTCHVILSPDHFERVDQINPAGEEELDLLDLAPELSDYSRLGCQIQVESNDPDTLVVKVPTQKRDARTLE